MTTPIGYQFQATSTIGQINLTIKEGQRTPGVYAPEINYGLPAGVYTALVSYSGPEGLRLMCEDPSWHTSVLIPAGTSNERRQGAGIVNLTVSGRVNLRLSANATNAGFTASVTLIPQLMEV